MAKFWCITCEDEVEHRADYCHSRCGNDCDQVCSRCNNRTLTTKLANPLDSDKAAIRWATGEAQREAKLTGRSGEILIEVPREANGLRYFRTAFYNTRTGDAGFNP